MRLPDFRRIEGDWSDRPIAIVGGGPSLAGFDLERLRGKCRVIAVNEIMMDMPWADLGFSLDITWVWRRHVEIEKRTNPVLFAMPDDGKLGYQFPEAAHITYIKRQRSDVLSADPVIISSGGTSGFGAFNVSWLLKGRDIFLFGFDYGTNQGQHHYDDRKYAWYQKHDHWAGWARKFEQTLPQLRSTGTRVTNVGLTSAITAFPKVSLDDGVAMIEELARMAA